MDRLGMCVFNLGAKGLCYDRNVYKVLYTYLQWVDDIFMVFHLAWKANLGVRCAYAKARASGIFTNRR